MNFLQHQQLIGLQRNADDEIQRCIAPVDEFVLALFDDVAHFGLAREDVGGYVPEDATFFGFGVGGEEFGEADFSLSRHEDYEMPSDGCGSFFRVV